jgi:heme/copper-type cytochrome/quinol oxidase subunit 2
VVWTLLPGVILVILGLPSLSLLYEVESGFLIPDLTLKVVGSQ